MWAKSGKRGPRKAAFALWGKEEQQNEREMTFCKKVVASDMELATTWSR